MELTHWTSLAALTCWTGVISKLFLLNWGALAVPIALVFLYLGERKLSSLYR